MKLNELLGLKRFKQQSPKDVFKFLKNDLKGNLRFLGHGSNGLALTDGVKCYKFWIHDRAYEKYMQFCIENQDNPFVPKLYSRVKVLPNLINGHDVKYIKMELLKELPSDKIHIDVMKTKEEYLTGLFDIFEHCKSIDLLKEKLKCENLSDLVIDLYKFTHEIMQFLNKLTLDIHHQNIMMRGKQLVVIDPVTNGNDIDLNDELIGMWDDYVEDEE